MTKHTPGPWRICDGFSGIDARIIDAGPHTSDIAWIPCSAEDDPEKVRDANARLIAAAPDMLEALENLVACAEQHGWDESLSGAQILMADARAAIAKAKGESAE